MEWKVQERHAEGLADLEPGSELADHLETIDRSSLNGHELVTLLQARVRQISHLQAAMYADIWELAHAPGGFADSAPERTPEMDELASDEIAAALNMTSRTADGQLSLAYLLSRLPRVLVALDRGVIDRPFAGWSHPGGQPRTPVRPPSSPDQTSGGLAPLPAAAGNVPLD